MTRRVTAMIQTEMRSLARLAVASAVLTVFWRVLRYPFVQDDWEFIYHLHFGGAWPIVVDALSPFGKVFFRPFGMLYIVGMYEAFGEHPVWYHAVALAIHCVNCWLVCTIFTRLSGRLLTGVMTAIIYGTAVTVHLTPLVWVVGIYDLAGMTFALLALRSWRDGRPLASAVAFGLALATKESTVFLIAVFVAFVVLFTERAGIGRALIRLWFHALVLLVYAVVKLAGIWVPALSDAHPYRLSFSPRVIWDGVDLYVRWLGHALAPLDGEAAMLAIPAVIGLTATIWIVSRSGVDWRGHETRVIAFCLIWAMCGLAPVLGLSHHRYDYYLTYAWAPIAFLAVLSVESLITSVANDERWLYTAFLLWSVAATWSNATVFKKKEEPVGMVAMASPVNIALQIKGLIPSLPTDTTLVFDHLNVDAFGRAFAPRVWYEDPSIEVTRADEVQCDNGALTATPRNSVARVLDDRRVRWFDELNGRLTIRSLESVHSTICGTK